MVKFLPAMWETWVQFLGWEDPDWRREWQPTPVFLPGEFHGQRSLVGYSPWGHEESDMTKPFYILQVILLVSLVSQIKGDIFLPSQHACD